MSTTIPVYPFDPDGNAATNLVREQQPIESTDVFDYFYIIPKQAPFYAEGVKLVMYPGGRELKEGVDYNFGHHFRAASHTIGQAVYGSISFYDHGLKGIVDMEYQNLGGAWTLDEARIVEILANEIRNPRITTWETIVELPFQFPVVNHKFDVEDFTGMSDAVDEMKGIKQAILDSGSRKLDLHIADYTNPHKVTKDQVGLGLVDNYPTAAVGEAEAGVANNRFMTPLRTRQLIDVIATAALNLHKADKANPHETTKAQVGLGLVQNFQLASQAEAEIGSSNARYMTPLRTRESIEKLVGNAFQAHLADSGNPHKVNKAQVGLGNVPNFLVSTETQASEASSNELFMTPLMTRASIKTLIGQPFDAHRNDFSNPHFVTKVQVGLGSVSNYDIASEAEAADATSNTKYMTPLRVRQSIAALVGEISGGHAGDMNNPHNTTAAQVGAYTYAEADQLLGLKLNIADAAIDSDRVYGFDQAQFEQRIKTFTVAEADKLAGKTVADLTLDILAGKSADSGKLAGQTLEQILGTISGTVDSTDIQFVVPAIPSFGPDSDPTYVQPCWMKIGSIVLVADRGITFDSSLMLTGGRNNDALDDDLPCTAMMTLACSMESPDVGGEQILTVKTAELRYLVENNQPFTMGYRMLGGQFDGEVEIWVFSNTPRERIAVTELAYRQFKRIVMTSPATANDVIATRPIGVVDFPVIHGYTGIATPDQASAGASSKLIMTPATTKQVVTEELVDTFSSLNDTVSTLADSFA